MATDNKYDRQLRLWGSHGQRALSEARLLLLGAGATGTEAVKNLVLPGVGHVHVVDGRTVTADDCADNFFVTQAHMGQPLARVTQELLVEMNPDVTGSFDVAEPLAFAAGASALSSYTLVIATQMTYPQAAELDALCRAAGVPLILGRTFGLIGQVRLSVGEHLVVESKPNSTKPDWRLTAPCPELQAFADTFDLEGLTSDLHSHAPFPVLLIKLMAEFLAKGNTLPKSFKEGKAFKAFVQEKTPSDYLNYAEALENAHYAYTHPSIPREVAEVLASAKTRDVTASTNKFWVVAKAMAGFVDAEGGGLLPQCAVLPDLTATAEWYIRLQKIYKAKATADAVAVTKRVRKLEAAFGAGYEPITDDYVEMFCRNAQYIRAYKYRSISDELAPETALKENIAEELWAHGDMQPLKWYILLRAHDQKGTSSDESKSGEGAAESLLGAARELCTQLELGNDTVTLAQAKELLRYVDCEPHNIAAVVGGVVAQEAVKVITQQYQPLKNTYVYNGIAALGVQVEL